MSLGIIASSHADTGTPGIPVTTGLQLWLDADDASTFTFGTGSAISQWNDKSGNTRHATQATSGNRPTRSTGVQNSRAAVVAAATQWMSSTGLPTAVDNLTVFVACKRTGGNSTVSVVLNNGAPNTSGYGLMMRASGANIGLLRCGVAVDGTSTADPAAAGVLTLQRASGTWSLRLNGTATSLSSTSAPFSPSTPTYVPTQESNHEFQGHIYEVAVYNQALNSTDRGSVESYLKTKWGTP